MPFLNFFRWLRLDQNSRVSGSASQLRDWSTLTWTLGVAVLLVLWGVAGRWWLETPNFKSVGAAALLAGILLRDWRWAVAVPLVSLLLSDWRLGGYQWGVAVTVYGSTGLYGLLGVWAGAKKPSAARGAVARALGLALVGSLQFFLLTNLAVWMWSGWYGPGGTELVRCFLSALPFYKWTLLGDLMFFALPLSIWYGLAGLRARPLTLAPAPPPRLRS